MISSWAREDCMLTSQCKKAHRLSAEQSPWQAASAHCKLIRWPTVMLMSLESNSEDELAVTKSTAAMAIAKQKQSPKRQAVCSKRQPKRKQRSGASASDRDHAVDVNCPEERSPARSLSHGHCQAFAGPAKHVKARGPALSIGYSSTYHFWVSKTNSEVFEIYSKLHLAPACDSSYKSLLSFVQAATPSVDVVGWFGRRPHRHRAAGGAGRGPNRSLLSCAAALSRARAERILQ